MGVDISSATMILSPKLAVQSTARLGDIDRQAGFSIGMIFANRLFSGLKSNPFFAFLFSRMDGMVLPCRDFGKNSIIRLFANEGILVPSSAFGFYILLQS